MAHSLTKKPKHAKLATIHAKLVLDHMRMTVPLVMLLSSYMKENVLKFAHQEPSQTQKPKHVTLATIVV